MITTGQAAATSTPQTLCNIPAGEAWVSLSNSSASAGAATVTAAGSSAGIPLAPGDTTWFRTFPTQKATTLSVTAASTATVGFVVSSYNDQ